MWFSSTVLTAARGTDHGNEFAAVDLEVDAAEHMVLIEGLVQPFDPDFNDRRCLRASPAACSCVVAHEARLHERPASQTAFPIPSGIHPNFEPVCVLNVSLGSQALVSAAMEVGRLPGVKLTTCDPVLHANC